VIAQIAATLILNGCIDALHIKGLSFVAAVAVHSAKKKKMMMKITMTKALTANIRGIA